MQTLTVLAFALVLLQALAPIASAGPAQPPVLPPAIGGPLAGTLDSTEGALCGVPAAAPVCGATRGEPGASTLRPCQEDEVSSSNNLLAFAAWYAVHAYERRELFTPESKVLGQDWPLPATGLPIPDAAPSVCRNLWDDGRTLTGTS